MSLDKDTAQKIQELQILDQNLQNIIMQKQAFQLELNESENAVSELKNAEGDVFKIVGGIMIKSEKSALMKEVEEKKKLINLRVSSIEKQENLIEGKIEQLKNEVDSALSKEAKNK